MRQIQYIMKPQDIVILLKIISDNNPQWNQSEMAKSLKLSQSEISQFVARSKYSGLLDISGKKVMTLAFMDFLIHGLPYVFPQKPGPIVRGIPTAHSAQPICNYIKGDEVFVWPYSKGNIKGQTIVPLYPTVPSAVEYDPKLHELLALVDILRVGRAREKEMAKKELKQRILNGNQGD